MFFDVPLVQYRNASYVQIQLSEYQMSRSETRNLFLYMVRARTTLHAPPFSSYLESKQTTLHSPLLPLPFRPMYSSLAALHLNWIQLTCISTPRFSGPR